MMAASPRNMSEVARLSFSAAISPRKPPRITIAVLMYHSGRTASFIQAADPGVALGKRRKGLGGISPDRGGDDPAEDIETGEHAEREHEHRQSDPDREPVFRQPACAVFHRPSLFVATSGRIIKQTALLRYAGPVRG